MSKSEGVSGHSAPIQFQVKTPKEVAQARSEPARGMAPDEVQRFLDQPIRGVGSFRGVRDATEEEINGVPD